MTQFSQNSSDGRDDGVITAIVADLRRQREDLERLSQSSTESSAETARLMDKIAELRRRLQAVNAYDAEGHGLSSCGPR